MADHVTYNRETGSIEVSLPDEFSSLYQEIVRELMDAFGYDPITPDLLVKMNLFVMEKLNTVKKTL